jgi:hypothetical protein
MMTQTPVSVRVEVYHGDELADVVTVQCDADTAAALEEYRQTGSCAPEVLDGLRALLPHALPATHAKFGDLDRQLREDLCSAFLQASAVPVQAELCFRFQKN